MLLLLLRRRLNMDDVILSIYVPTYNHEKYIARALDSILMQKTDYAYEVLVGNIPEGFKCIIGKRICINKRYETPEI